MSKLKLEEFSILRYFWWLMKIMEGDFGFSAGFEKYLFWTIEIKTSEKHSLVDNSLFHITYSFHLQSKSVFSKKFSKKVAGLEICENVSSK